MIDNKDIQCLRSTLKSFIWLGYIILEITVLYLNSGSCRRQFGIWKWSCTCGTYMDTAKEILRPSNPQLMPVTTQIQHIYFYSSAGQKPRPNILFIVAWL
jgi:hypothetical protein